jgi:hypothetical protein
MLATDGDCRHRTEHMLIRFEARAMAAAGVQERALKVPSVFAACLKAPRRD